MKAGSSLSTRLRYTHLEAERPVQASIARHVIAGIAGVFVLFGVVGGWAATSEFAGAVIAPGVLVVESAHKKIQHPTGGIVSELLVNDGDHVNAGDVLVRLDSTMTKANLAIISKSHDQLLARLARLEAERDGASEVVFPPGLTEARQDYETQLLMAGERGLFQLRRKSRDGQKAQLSERIAQLEDEIEGLLRQINAKSNEIDLIAVELDGVKQLYEQKLVTLQRVNVLERETARLRGEHGQLLAATAQAKGKISETRLQILQVDQDLRSEVQKEIREAQAKVAELVERRVAAQDQLKRVELKAPQAGVVHQLAVHTVGGVINAGEPVMLIVPANDHLPVEVKISPADIDNVRVGQKATLRMLAFDMRTTPELPGEVIRVSPDLSSDQRTGQTYYTARIEISDEAKQLSAASRFVPGMPVETFIQTPERTVLSYLTKPLMEQVRRAFREK